ncbi:MAG: hypothetical protein AAF846_11475 [Chloroflexota bacterium]
MTHQATRHTLAVQGIRSETHHDIQALLREHGIAHLKHQAGYIPSQDESPLFAPVIYEQQHTLHLWRLREIHHMLQEHPPLALEWVMSLCAMKRQVPDEMIPYYLRLGARNQALRPWIKHILSDRALWLIEQAQDSQHAWYKEGKTVTINTLVHSQIEAYSEMIYWINHSLERDAMSHSHHKGIIKLMHFRLMWTEQITTRFLEALIVSHIVATYRKGSQIEQTIATQAVYKMPLHYLPDLLQELETGVVEWQATIDHAKEVFKLRQTMHTILTEAS